ncbi:MAG TPA: DNA-binding response regulator [Verrucomicrobia bacterium]|nr:MAG: DNA-binding response regulator [Lentisphaerae bacterium GWF2_57_35]HBA84389.1 DNA-binding response regulator [Verrucomicrobiota bacterium]
MSKPLILVAEDEAHIREGLADALTGEGYDVAVAPNGKAALESYEARRPALLILDVMMPEQSGYDVCRAVRRKDASTPILILTARGEEIDKVVGLELGADDYVAKPFGIRELLARVAALLRRVQVTAAPAPAVSETFAFGEAVIEPRKLQGRLQQRSFRISQRELRLMQFFAEHPEEVLSRDELLNAAWGVDYLGTTRTLDQHIAQLRKKVEPDPGRPQTLLTVHGAGYRYCPFSE